MTALTQRIIPMEFGQLRSEIDRLFRDFSSPISSDDATAVWMPRADIRETDHAFHLTLEVPGVSPNDIDVTFEDGTLSVTGMRKASTENTEGRFHRIERSYGRFNRTVNFGVAVDSNGIKATMENGVLELTVQKAEASKPKRVEIQSGASTQLASGDGSEQPSDAIDVEVSESA
ncbi:MAG: Hsp20/alpha crystallin family protein [Rubricoccaceae bacterium]|nr:Hsp20/alpha crystallin family protein [Rubricoccaceae bacterium]